MDLNFNCRFVIDYLFVLFTSFLKAISIKRITIIKSAEDICPLVKIPLMSIIINKAMTYYTPGEQFLLRDYSKLIGGYD